MNALFLFVEKEATQIYFSLYFLAEFKNTILSIIYLYRKIIK